MGIVEGQRADSSGLGCECSGVVCETGSDVNSLAVGDRVIVFTTGTLSTRVTTKATVCAKMPDSLSFEDGATMPCVYGTVVHSLINEGRLEKDMVSHSLTLYETGADLPTDRPDTLCLRRCWNCSHSDCTICRSNGKL